MRTILYMRQSRRVCTSTYGIYVFLIMRNIRCRKMRYYIRRRWWRWRWRRRRRQRWRWCRATRVSKEAAARTWPQEQDTIWPACWDLGHGFLLLGCTKCSFCYLLPSTRLRGPREVVCAVCTRKGAPCKRWWWNL
jgi:hypothetical protein